MIVRRCFALVLAGCLLASGARAADPAPGAQATPAAGAAVPITAAPAVTPPEAAATPAATIAPALTTAPTTTLTTAPTATAPVAIPAPGRPAATVQTPPYSPGPSAGSLVQTIFALMLVLGILFALAWVMKRYGPKMQGGSAGMRIVGALNLGGRERIMVVEVGDQWIVVGASPGRINALATMPKQGGSREGAQEGSTVSASAQASLSEHTPSASSFAQWLKQTIDKRNAN